MGRVAFVFPGQGSQRVGMARDLYDSEPAARALLDRADALIGFSLTRLMFDGPEAQLTATENAQPAILAHSAAALALVEARGLRADLVAGHSLGEHSAVMAAGALAFDDALLLVRRRGELMARVGRQVGGAMAAVIGLDTRAVEEACRAAGEVGTVIVANYNCPGQVVISGEAGGVAGAARLAKAAGAKRVVPLRVSGGFHSPLMAPAGEQLREVLAGVRFRDAAVPVVSNVDATPRTEAAAIRAALARQITGAVLWEQSVRAMIERGVGRFVEIGPGAVLSGLIRRIGPGVEVQCAGTAEEIARLEC